MFSILEMMRAVGRSSGQFLLWTSAMNLLMDRTSSALRTNDAATKSASFSIPKLEGGGEGDRVEVQSSAPKREIRAAQPQQVPQTNGRWPAAIVLYQLSCVRPGRKRVVPNTRMSFGRS